MMKYLADTHILLWMFLEPVLLPRPVAEILLNEQNEIYYSPVSIWEISIKFQLKKLSLSGGTPEDFFAALRSSFLHCKPVEASETAAFYQLPRRHADPFDRFLIWTAIQNDLTLLSVDRSFAVYQNDGLKLGGINTE